MMKFDFFKSRLFLFLALSLCAWAVEEEKTVADSFQIMGEVPEGWKVVELSDAPLVEKWIALKNGERKKVFLRPFVLKPVSNEESKFTVSNPLETSSGHNMSTVVEAQNENLVQSQEELSAMLNRLKQLLRTLPTPTEQEKKS